MTTSVNTASYSPETAVRNERKSSIKAETIDTKTKDIPSDSVEIQNDGDSKKSVIALGGIMALVVALTSSIFKKKPPKVTTTEVVRVFKNNIDFKKAEAISIINKYLNDGEKLTLKTPKEVIKKVYKKLAVKFHPDTSAFKNKMNVEDIFKEIGAAYALIK